MDEQGGLYAPPQFAHDEQNNKPRMVGIDLHDEMTQGGYESEKCIVFVEHELP